jgi:hypothetical protein
LHFKQKFPSFFSPQLKKLPKNKEANPQWYFIGIYGAAWVYGTCININIEKPISQIWPKIIPTLHKY